MKKVLSITACLLIAATLLCSCGLPAAPQSGLKIVCTSFVQYDFIRNILGSEENLILLNKNGADMHGFEPTAKDIIEIRTASLFVYVGGVSDNWVERTVSSSENPNLNSVAMMDYVDTLTLEDVESLEYGEGHTHNHDDHSHDHNPEDADEHIWLSLKNAIAIVNGLCDEICAVDPENAEKYKANTAAYVAKLEALKKEYETVFTNSERSVILFADRFPFAYLTHDYGISHLAAFTGCSSESEITAETFTHLIEHTTELSLPCIMMLEGSDGKTAKTVSNATGAKILTVDSLQSVSETDIRNGANYYDIMSNNLEIFKEALN